MVIVVTGLPCTGKSTIARRISSEFRLPYIAKDAFKESLFETLGFSDRAWSKKLSAASYGLMFEVLTSLLEVGGSCVFEANFDPKVHGEPLASILGAFQARVAQVHCLTEPDVLLERFQSRWERGERHPGHVDHATLPELGALARRPSSPIELPGPVFELDTTDRDHLGISALLAAIRAEWERE
jgi:predicted kinase